MTDLSLAYIPDADEDSSVYLFADQLKEDAGTATTASVLNSKFNFSKLSGGLLESLSMPGAIEWNNSTKVLSLEIKNGDLSFANRDMEVGYEWWIELSDERLLKVAEGRAFIARGAAE